MSTGNRPIRSRLRRSLLGTAVAFVLVCVAVIALASGLGPWLVAGVVCLFGLGFLFMWGVFRLLRRLLWRVGRRLAFTYFLVGILPIPMFLFLLAVGAYLLGGFFLGHLFRSAVALVHEQIFVAAETRLEDPASFATAPATASDIAFAYYFHGRRVGGDPRAPLEYPDWLEDARIRASEGIDRRERMPPVLSLPDDSLTLGTAVSRGSFGVVGFFDGHLETRLRDLSGVWIDLVRSGDPRTGEVIVVTILGERFAFQPLSRGQSAEDRRQFLSRGGYDSSFWVHGFDVAGQLLALETGEVVAPDVAASLTGTPTVILGLLFSNSREVDTLAWLTFVVPAFLLFDVFAVAWIMALFMIFALSRAVNRLSRATSALRKGDLATRIAVRRKDQLGALHASFNEMADSLERLIATEAQKESLEKELEIARSLQQSLIPSKIIEGEDVEFATHFEPSAAIGGDYFDILRVDPGRLAVVIGDVAGHGLSAGLRMAMLKAALLILVEEEEDPQTILRRLDRLVRSGEESHGFVTFTLALLDLADGRLDLTNAGHPPTYLLRRGGVEEVVLPGAPLGAFGDIYGSTTLQLVPGDTVVWLSDGFIEAVNEEGELFGYERTLSSLGGGCETASEVRDRLLDHIQDYTSGRPAEDDRTLVVMRFLSQVAGRGTQVAGRGQL